MQAKSVDSGQKNYIPACLPAEVHTSLLSQLQTVQLEQGSALYDIEQPIDIAKQALVQLLNCSN